MFLKRKMGATLVLLCAVVTASAWAGGIAPTRNYGKFKAIEYRSIAGSVNALLVQQTCDGSVGGWWIGSPSTAVGTTVLIEHGCGTSNEK